eukprot:scaffold21612_cov115-Isochrysis_galbana.AAC.5
MEQQISVLATRRTQGRGTSCSSARPRPSCTSCTTYRRAASASTRSRCAASPGPVSNTGSPISF